MVSDKALGEMLAKNMMEELLKLQLTPLAGIQQYIQTVNNIAANNIMQFESFIKAISSTKAFDFTDAARNISRISENIINNVKAFTPSLADLNTKATDLIRSVQNDLNSAMARNLSYISQNSLSPLAAIPAMPVRAISFSENIASAISRFGINYRTAIQDLVDNSLTDAALIKETNDFLQEIKNELDAEEKELEAEIEANPIPDEDMAVINSHFKDKAFSDPIQVSEELDSLQKNELISPATRQILNTIGAYIKKNHLALISIILTLLFHYYPNSKDPTVNNNYYISNYNTNQQEQSQYKLYYVATENACIRNEADKRSRKIDDISRNYIVKLIDKCGNWALVEYQTIKFGNQVTESGWINLRNIARVKNLPE